jgi:hypothetical protein
MDHRGEDTLAGQPAKAGGDRPVATEERVGVVTS